MNSVGTFHQRSTAPRGSDVPDGAGKRRTESHRSCTLERPGDPGETLGRAGREHPLVRLGQAGCSKTLIGPACVNGADLHQHVGVLVLEEGVAHRDGHAAHPGGARETSTPRWSGASGPCPARISPSGKMKSAAFFRPRSTLAGVAQGGQGALRVAAFTEKAPMRVWKRYFARFSSSIMAKPFQPATAASWCTRKPSQKLEWFR